MIQISFISCQDERELSFIFISYAFFSTQFTISFPTSTSNAAGHMPEPHQTSYIHISCSPF